MNKALLVQHVYRGQHVFMSNFITVGSGIKLDSPNMEEFREALKRLNEIGRKSNVMPIYRINELREINSARRFT